MGGVPQKQTYALKDLSKPHSPPPILPHKGGGIPPARVSSAVRDIMSSRLGVLRNAPGLETAIQELSPLVEKSGMALVGLMIAVAAHRREESRGSHTRTDFPAVSAVWAKRQILSLDDIRDYAQGLSTDLPLAAAGV